MMTYREERIRALAHEIWEREGHPHGRDVEHWRLATEAYEAEAANARLDDMGKPTEQGRRPSRGATRRAPAPPAPKGGVADRPATARKRRTKAEIAAAAAGVAGAAAAAVAATVAATRRKRAPKAEQPAAESPPEGQTPAAPAPPRRGRKARTKGGADEVASPDVLAFGAAAEAEPAPGSPTEEPDVPGGAAAEQPKPGGRRTD